MQDSGGGGGGKKPKEEKGAAPSKMPAPQWCPWVLKRDKTQIAKDASKRVGREKKKRKSGIIGLTIYGP
jgi:hypothetical protein